MIFVVCVAITLGTSTQPPIFFYRMSSHVQSSYQLHKSSQKQISQPSSFEFPFGNASCGLLEAFPARTNFFTSMHSLTRPCVLLIGG